MALGHPQRRGCGDVHDPVSSGQSLCVETEGKGGRWGENRSLLWPGSLRRGGAVDPLGWNQVGVTHCWVVQRLPAAPQGPRDLGNSSAHLAKDRTTDVSLQLCAPCI